MGSDLRSDERKLLAGSNPAHAIGSTVTKSWPDGEHRFDGTGFETSRITGSTVIFCLYSTVVVRLTCNQKVLSSILNGGSCCDVRVVKEIDLKSIGLCPRRFKSCSQRLWGISSNGRALALHARGSGIDAHILQCRKFYGRLV